LMEVQQKPSGSKMGCSLLYCCTTPIMGENTVCHGHTCCTYSFHCSYLLQASYTMIVESSFSPRTAREASVLVDQMAALLLFLICLCRFCMLLC
jgi:hypothetical protein